MNSQFKPEENQDDSPLLISADGTRTSQLKICTACKHHSVINKSSGNDLVDYFGGTRSIHACAVRGEIDPVTGAKLYRHCEWMRSENGDCKPSGLAFAGKEINGQTQS